MSPVRRVTEVDLLKERNLSLDGLKHLFKKVCGIGWPPQGA